MEINILIFSALSIGFIHTIIGPDHYIPFIVMAKARNWSLKKTLFITLLCGLGHVLGSVILGVVGVLIGTSLHLLEDVESLRGNIASWLLIGIGVAYAAWGIRLALRRVEHTHKHEHDVQPHGHKHKHFGNHAHIHGNDRSFTPWALFIVFILGPCEPLIPILIYPAAKGSWMGVFWVSLAFAVTTIATMTGVVMLASAGFMKLKLDFLERYVHVLAGGIIALSGLTIKIFGL